MIKRISICAAICAVTLVAFSAQAQNPVSYTFTSFDVPFVGASNTKAFAINPAGDVVGRFIDNARIPRGFLRHADGTFAQPIDVPVRNSGTVLRGIDARGDFVGKYFDPNNPSETHGFYLGVDGTFLSFDVPFSGANPGSTVAHSLNNRGQIVGHYSAPTAVPGCAATFPLFHGFLRDATGSFTKIDYPGATSTRAQGIDDSGNVVGFYIIVPSSNTTCNISAAAFAHGFLLDPKGNYTTVDAPATSGAVGSIVGRINEPGDVAGAYSTTSLTLADLFGDTALASGTIHVFGFVLWNNGNFTSFTVPFGNGVPLGINPHGGIVGVWIDGLGDHGFLGTR